MVELTHLQKARPQRQAARDAGEPHYFTGRPCKYGHISKRNTVDASCIECRLVAKDTWLREHNQKTALAKRKNMSPAEREIYLTNQARWRREERMRDPERVRERERHHGRLKRQRYPERKLAEVRKRQTAKMQRIPPWADLEAVKAFYVNRPDGFEVDHVVPLRGKTVSGLHVIDNLQYLPPAENRTKLNKFDDDWVEWRRENEAA